MIFGECEHYSPEFYAEKRVKVRKQHRCCETGRAILPGEHAWRIAGKWEGDVVTRYQCDSAYHFARYINLRLNGGHCAVAFGEVGEAVSNLAEDIDGYGMASVGAALESIWDDISLGRREWTTEDKCDEAERFLEAKP